MSIWTRYFILLIIFQVTAQHLKSLCFTNGCHLSLSTSVQNLLYNHTKVFTTSAKSIFHIAWASSFICFFTFILLIYSSKFLVSCFHYRIHNQDISGYVRYFFQCGFYFWVSCISLPSDNPFLYFREHCAFCKCPVRNKTSCEGIKH